MKRQPRSAEVTGLTSRIDGLAKKMANPNFSNDAAKQMGRQAQRLHVALKILTKPVR